MDSSVEFWLNYNFKKNVNHILKNMGKIKELRLYYFLMCTSEFLNYTNIYIHIIIMQKTNLIIMLNFSINFQ